MSLVVIGEQKIAGFKFNVDKDVLAVTLSSVLTEGVDGADEYQYSVIVTDKGGNPVMKEIHSDFQVACDVYDRLSILVGQDIIHK